jgi:HEAT repeat protein
MTSAEVTVAAVTPASLIRPGDLEIVGLRIDRFDVASGEVELAFDAVSSVRLAGSLTDESVQSVLCAAVEGQLESAERLQTVDLMKHLASSERIREGLMYALLHDDNPAVRLRAIETLKALVIDDGVRAALRHALMSDRNPGVRVEAIDALKAVRDAATAAVFERRAIDDGNGYIRAEAERILSRWKEAAVEQL